MATITFGSSGFEPFTLALDRFRDNVADAEPALRAMAEYQVKTVNARQFREEGTAETGSWAPLSPPYARWKATRRPGRKILVFDGDLKASMTVPGEGVFEVTHDQFIVGTDIEYAKYHQQGTPQMPARRLLGAPRKRDTQLMAKMLQRWIIEGRVS